MDSTKEFRQKGFEKGVSKMEQKKLGLARWLTAGWPKNTHLSGKQEKIPLREREFAHPVAQR